MTQFTPLALQEGVTATVRTSGIAYTATALDIQSAGVLFDYTDLNAPFGQLRRFIPWVAVTSISQTVQE